MIELKVELVNKGILHNDTPIPKYNYIIKRDNIMYNRILIKTSFLDTTASMQERIYCIIHNIQHQPVCKYTQCTNKVSFKTIKTGYCNTCSPSCGVKFSENLKKKTMLDRYGVENISKSKEFRDIIKQTCLDKYGVSCTLQSNQSKQKIKQTCLDKYGVDHHSQSEEIKLKKIKKCQQEYGVDWYIQTEQSRDKLRHYNMEKYGVDNPFKSDICKKHIRDVVFEKYGLEWAAQSKDVRDKIKNTMLSRYGVEYPYQHKSCISKYKHTTFNNYNVFHYKQKDIPPESLKILQNKDELFHRNHNLEHTLTRISSDLSVSITTVGDAFRRFEIDVKRFISSTGERELSDFLKLHNIPHIINSRSHIKPFELDILIPHINLAIEYCGLYWHSDRHNRIDNNYHKRKMDMCKDVGIRLLTIFEDEWLENSDVIKRKILTLCGMSNDVVYARKTEVVNISTIDKMDFFNLNHIQLNGPGSINYALRYNDNIVACISFIELNGGKFILNRYATSTRVVGGFSKLMNHFEKTNNWSQIVTFADRRWSEGDLYTSNSFTLDKVLPPDYSYSPNGKIRIHKFNYRHKNLHRLLKTYDPLLSERENCDNNNVLRIWDCGKFRFVKINK